MITSYTCEDWKGEFTQAAKRKLAFEDTISILKNIDLLITIDSSIVHLAGAMDIPTYLLLGPISEWRWFNNNEKVWYNSVNILHNNNKEDIYSISKIEKIIKNMFNV